ncbi:hypothetical protein VN97_g2599 [Penicillium thymicola]|uniref:Uncharacterized protein n=1 Tax=Penicillium thymicola TaxID=293382 RepID=A0AAI9XBA6_PENTH|nr:hypothetical protein VN97_g2599 [Penicillium thymicola]
MFFMLLSLQMIFSFTQRPTFLGIVWKYVPMEDLVDQSEGEMLELPPEVGKNTMKCCLQFRQFMPYYTDIADYSGTKPMDWDWDWDRFDLGPFSTIRSL